MSPLRTELRLALKAIRAARTHLSRAYLASETGSQIEERAQNARWSASELESVVRNTLKLVRDVAEVES